MKMSREDKVIAVANYTFLTLFALHVYCLLFMF